MLRYFGEALVTSEANYLFHVIICSSKDINEYALREKLYSASEEAINSFNNSLIQKRQ